MVIEERRPALFLLSVGEKLKPFFYGKHYLVIVALFTAFIYYANLPLLGLTVFSLLATCHLLFYRDLSTFMPLPIFAVLLLSDFTVFNTIAPFLVLLIPFFALVSHFIIYPIKKLFVGKALYSFIAISVALLLGGIASPFVNNYVYGLVTSLTVGALLLFAYFLFTNYFCPPENFKANEHFCFMLLFLGVTLFLELLIPSVRDSFTFGWGSTNAGAPLLLLSICVGWYFVLYKKYSLLSLPLLAIQYVALVLSNSDACMGIAFVMTPVFLICALFIGKVPQRKQIVLSSLIALLLIALIVGFSILAFSNEIRALVSEHIRVMLDDNGRGNFYATAFEEFTKYPIFGVGQGYTNDALLLNLSGVVTFNFHSTFFHVLATMGTVGILAYGYYFFSRTRIFMLDNTPFSRFSFIAFVMLESYGAVDTCEFNVVPIMMAVTLFIVVVEMTARTKKQQLPLFDYRLGK